MQLEITVDPKQALKDLKADQERHVPYALSRAVNSTALDVQRAIRNRQRSIFTLRRPEWADRSVKMVKFATKTDPVAQLGIHPPGAMGDRRADIIGKFEDQTVKLPKGRTIAIPVSSRIKRGNAGIIAKRDRPRAYNFRKVGNRIVGDRGTFILRKADGSGLIMQREKGGRSRGAAHVLYILARRARIKPNLRFQATAQLVVDTRFTEHMVRELDNALRTAR